MSKSEEKIKTFLSDEKKVKALASDEAFIEKVSGGTATPEIYAEEFKKFGLDLSEDEAKEISKTTMELLNIPVEKLADIYLENVAGGMQAVVPPRADKIGGLMGDSTPVPSAYIALTVTGVVGALGCSIASAVCKAVSVNAMKNGNAAKSATYQKAAIGLGVCVAPFVVAGTVGGIGIGKNRH